MSCSWRMGSGDFTAVQAAVENAHQLDCVLCFAAGNDNGAVTYPARYRRRSRWERPARATSARARPPATARLVGQQLRARTRRRRPRGPDLYDGSPGSGGYSSGDYFNAFNGTSSATPLAAGICALLYCVNPDLTNEEVRQILQETAEDQVGPPGEDTVGWDQYMGWGRVNAYQAVRRARGFLVLPDGSGDFPPSRRPSTRPGTGSPSSLGTGSSPGRATATSSTTARPSQSARRAPTLTSASSTPGRAGAGAQGLHLP